MNGSVRYAGAVRLRVMMTTSASMPGRIVEAVAPSFRSSDAGMTISTRKQLNPLRWSMKLSDSRLTRPRNVFRFRSFTPGTRLLSRDQPSDCGHDLHHDHLFRFVRHDGHQDLPRLHDSSSGKDGKADHLTGHRAWDLRSGDLSAKRDELDWNSFKRSDEDLLDIG